MGGQTKRAKGASGPSRPRFPWPNLLFFTTIGFAGAGFNYGVSIESANDPVPMASVTTTFTVLALLFIIGWIWISAVIIKGYLERLRQYKLSPGDLAQSEPDSGKRQGSSAGSGQPGLAWTDIPMRFLDNWEPLFKETDNMASDYKGRFYQHVGEYEVMDMDTGKIRWITSWSDDPQ